MNGQVSTHWGSMCWSMFLRVHNKLMLLNALKMLVSDSPVSGKLNTIDRFYVNFSGGTWAASKNTCIWIISISFGTLLVSNEGLGLLQLQDETRAWLGVAVLVAAFLLLTMRQSVSSMQSSYAYMIVLMSWGVYPAMSSVLVVEPLAFIPV